MALFSGVAETSVTSSKLPELCEALWRGRVSAASDAAAKTCTLTCSAAEVVDVCAWLSRDLAYAFATLVVEEASPQEWLLTYVFYKSAVNPAESQVRVQVRLDSSTPSLPSVSTVIRAGDWHEREIEDLFGLKFKGHPLLGEFILHEDWPEGVNPMRRHFDARHFPGTREREPMWVPPTIVVSPGAFAMPVGPVYSDFAESAHFLLETVGEDVIHTIPRFFYKYRGMEKIAEGKPVDDVLLLAERFSGTSAFAHGMAFCHAVERICDIPVPPRAQAIRAVLAELERLRHHAAAITAICNSTALAVGASQAALIEEDLLRLSCHITGHRYLFGAVKPAGVAFDLSDGTCAHLGNEVATIRRQLHELHRMLRYSSSFLDRLEEVGIITPQDAESYDLVGPIARASGLSRDLRKIFSYGAYGALRFTVPAEQEGDGYARLRVLFQEAEQSAFVIRQASSALPEGPVSVGKIALRGGAALGLVEAPLGAAFHWVRLGEDGTVARYHVTPPSFINWQAFHLAAENFAFQDFPIILASFGLSNAECDR